MTTLQIIILVSAITSVFVIALLVINQLTKKDEEDLNKWIILFDRKTKKFSEHRVNNYEENEDDIIISISDERLYHKFMDFCKQEKYHVCMINQARKVFDIFLQSRQRNDNK